jgi:deoxyribonuclease IV
MVIKFGPAGLGPVKEAISNLEEFSKKGLKACEIAFTYNVYIKADECAEIAKKARELDIELTVHAPYFVNLNSAEKAKREATKKRILDSCRIGELLGAKVVVFHPGYYGNKVPKPSLGKSESQASGYLKDRAETYLVIKEGIIEIMKEIKKNGWKIQIAPETMGKINVFGSIEEISALAKETGCAFCLDFAHILARDKKVDYKKIEELFPQKEWHCHFSGIVYNEKGERNHIKTEKKAWAELLKNLPRDREIRIINESPDMIEDAIEGLRLSKVIK